MERFGNGAAESEHARIAGSRRIRSEQRRRPRSAQLSHYNYPPVGDTWYNSLHAKATKRVSHGLDFVSSFTWSRQEYIGSEQDFVAGFVNPAQNDINNRQQNNIFPVSTSPSS